MKTAVNTNNETGEIVDNFKIEVLILAGAPGAQKGLDILLRLTTPDGKPPTDVLYKPRKLDTEGVFRTMLEIYNSIGAILTEAPRLTLQGSNSLKAH